jgi:hypothetical protein
MLKQRHLSRRRRRKFEAHDLNDVESNSITSPIFSPTRSMSLAPINLRIFTTRIMVMLISIVFRSENYWRIQIQTSWIVKRLFPVAIIVRMPGSVKFMATLPPWCHTPSRRYVDVIPWLQNHSLHCSTFFMTAKVQLMMIANVDLAPIGVLINCTNNK